MKLQAHIVVSFTVSAMLYMFFNSLAAAFISFLAGVFIDLDHWIDYFLQHRNLNIKNFFNVCTHPSLLDKLYLLLHSFEFVIIFWLIIYKFEPGILWIAAAIGMTQHIIFDYLSNKAHTKSYFYFITVRFARRFRREHLFR